MSAGYPNVTDNQFQWMMVYRYYGGGIWSVEEIANFFDFSETTVRNRTCERHRKGQALKDRKWRETTGNTAKFYLPNGKYLRYDQAAKLLLQRDKKCCRPGCDKVMSFRKRNFTIDHIYPVSLCHRDGWTVERTQSIDNIQLMCRGCNSKKSNDLRRA
ncbi:MAG: HNH endonuclease [Gammaproteobacteria bacterium AqS3]|nr:HNH endonuclease [Gammaproteobacteria bacterium AqS3]